MGYPQRFRDFVDIQSLIVIEQNDLLVKFADQVNSVAGEGYDMVLLPSVLGISSNEKAMQLLRSL